MPTARCPKRAPSRPPGNAAQPGQQRSRGDHEPGAQDRLVPDAGEEQDAAEHQRAEAAEEDERAQVGQRHGAVADHGRLDDRVGVAERAQHQPRAVDAAARAKAPMIRGAGPAPVRALDDGGHQAGHRRRDSSAGAEQVRLVGVGVPHLVEHADAERRARAG